MERSLVVDSGVDRLGALESSTQASFVPFKIIIDEEEMIDSNLSVSLLLDKMKKRTQKLITAAPSPDEFMKYIQKSGESFIVTISSKLSSSYAHAMMALNWLKESDPDTKVHVIDSKTAAAGETLVALKVKELINQKLHSSKIIEETNRYIENLDTYFICKSLDNLVKNGRISNTAALVGKLLSVVPIMGENGDGEIVLKEKARGEKRAFARLVEIIGERKADLKNSVMAITHVNAEDMALELKNMIRNTYEVKDIHIFESGGISTTYADNGGIIVAF